LGASANQATWVITSFAVSNAIALPLTGFLARRFGERQLFVWATLLFSAASLLCGLANSMGFLVLARALQGFVAGPMYPITQALLISIYPPHRRGQALALLAMVTVVAPIAGPILGGWITDNYSWEWIFFINIPIGIFASFVVRSQLAGRPERLEKPRMDYIGLATLVLGVGALQVLLDLGNDEDWFNSTKIVVLAIVAVVALAVFLVWVLTDKDPIVDLRLFLHRNFAAGTIAMVVSYAPFVGKYAGRFDLRLVASLAFVALSTTSFLRAGFNLDVDFQRIAAVQLLQGLGVALFFMPMLQILLSDLAPHEIASGSGLATFVRTLGGSFAASLTTWLWTHRTVEHHARLTEHVAATDPGMQQTVSALGQGDLQRGAMVLEQMIHHQASQIGFNEIFQLLGWMFLGVIALIWI